jgi:hypothetical protein
MKNQLWEVHFEALPSQFLVKFSTLQHIQSPKRNAPMQKFQGVKNFLNSLT